MSVRACLSTAVAAGAAAIALVSGALPAQAAPAVACGGTITTNTTLTRSLTCSGNALTLAQGVRLDLGGHTVRGDGTGAAIAVLAESSSGTTTTIVNGRVTGFVDGVVHTPEFTGTDYRPEARPAELGRGAGQGRGDGAEGQPQCAA